MKRPFGRLLSGILVLVFAFLLSSLSAGPAELPSVPPPAAKTQETSELPSAEPAAPAPSAEEKGSPLTDVPEETSPEADAVNETESEPLPEAEPVRAGGPLDPSWFDDAVFFGDSVLGVLQYYAINENGLGNAMFFSETSYSINAAATNKELPHYRGHEMTPQNIIKTVGATKVFFMLGHNDRINPEDVDKTLENWDTVVRNIRETVPEARIFIQSVTPLYAGQDRPYKTNELIDAYNERLRAFCEENDCTFVRIGEYFKDENGTLAHKYTRDLFIHLNTDGGKLWGELLKDPANYSIPPV